MKKTRLLFTVAYGAILNCIELIILSLLFAAEAFFFDNRLLMGSLYSGLRDGLDIIGVRLIFYFLFWIFSVTVFYKSSRKISQTLNFALFNSGFYIFFSLFMSLLIPFTREYLQASFFYFLILATFLSPWIIRAIDRSNTILKKISIN